MLRTGRAGRVGQPVPPSGALNVRAASQRPSAAWGHLASTGSAGAAHGTIHPVKRARPPLAQPPKGRAGGRSGLHRATQQLTAVRRVPQGAKARIRATETSRFSSGETGNLCAQQHQVGGRRPGPGSPRVDGIEPCWRQPAQTNDGHGARARKGACDAQNPAYRLASQ